MFIKPDELRAAPERNGLEPSEFVGLTRTVNPLTLIVLLRRAKKGKVSFAELGYAVTK